MSYQLKMGKIVEKEHKGTIAYIKKYHAFTGRLPPESKIYESIAKDHIKEDSAYYTKLKKAGL